MRIHQLILGAVCIAHLLGFIGNGRAAAAVHEYAVEVSAVVRETPSRIDFSWRQDPAATKYYIFKKQVADDQWTGPLAELAGSATSWTDSSVVSGQVYEYAFRKTLSFQSHRIEVEDGTDVTFTIHDSWNDGMCCHHGLGSYQVTGCGETYASGGDFGDQESSSFTVGELGGPCHELTVALTLDVYGTETTWELVDDQSGTILGQGGPYDTPHFGHICTGINCPPIEDRGTVLLIVEGSIAAAIAGEVDRLVLDLIGDGYRVIRKTTDPLDDVPAIREWVIAQHDQDPTVDTVFLLGHVPVPYSGNVQGAHSHHHGAWPADVYYAELDGEWTDTTVYNVSATRPANHNIPGDGKFDQTFLPSNVDLQIGRVDLQDLPAFSPLTEIDLLRRYLDKDHAWRRGEVQVEPRGLIDDNVGDALGLAFAASGWRNFANMFGYESVFEGDFFPDLESESYLCSYGCGGSSYTHCGGVGGTEDFASSTVYSVLTILYGSNFGDWDNTDNILRSPLGSAGCPLANFYSGRPVWNVHHLALGYPLGFAARLNQNNDHEYTVADGGRQIHIALMGDPTIKMYVVQPISDLVVDPPNEGRIRLSWTASGDQVEGYYIYRASGIDDPFERIHQHPVKGTEFVDLEPLPGYSVYMVRALRLETSASGTFYNLSCGVTGSPHISRPHLVAGPGPANENRPLVRVFPPSQDAGWEYEFSAYGASGYGVNLACGHLIEEEMDQIITGAGPGDIFGPHVRGFLVDGTPLPGLSFMAYGTNRHGVNVAAGDLDGDGFDEVITGAGPGPVFGPHVRGWKYGSAGTVSAMSGVNFMAYGTLKWGVNVSAGDLDGDGFDEILTGAGPGAAFGPHVRGWDVDSGTATAIPGIGFLAYGTNRYGVEIACGDLDGDGIDEMVTAPGPGEVFPAHIRGWKYDGDQVSPLPGFSFFAWPPSVAEFGAEVWARTDLDADGRAELVVGGGPDPAFGTTATVFSYDGSGITMLFSLEAFPSLRHGVKVAASHGP